jgi:hypothetical protein
LLATGDGTMAFMSQERKLQLQPKVKEILNKYGVKGRLSVNYYSTLVLTVTEGKIDFISNLKETCGLDPRLDDHVHSAERGHIDVNVYHFDNHFSGDALDFLREVYAAMMIGNWDNSQPEFDHFDRGWYISILIGRWNKPYKFVEKQD